MPKIFYYMRFHKRESIFLCILQAVRRAVQVVLQLLMMKTFAEALKGDFQGFLLWSAISLLVWGVFYLLGILLGYVQLDTIRKLNHRVRQDMLHSIWIKPQQVFREKDRGEYISQLTNHVQQIETLAWKPFFDGIGDVAYILWCMVSLAFIDWILLAASLVTAVIMWVLPKYFERKIERVSEESAQAMERGTSETKDMVFGLDILRSFGSKFFFMKKGEEASDHMEGPHARMKYTRGIISDMLGFFSVALQVFSMVLIFLLALYGRIPLAVIATGSNLYAGVSNGLSRMADFKVCFTASKPYFHQIEKESSNGKEKKETLLPLQHSIQLKNVSYGYGDRHILENLQLTIGKNQKIAIVGPSGSGKTTLLKCIMGWLQDYEGEILWDGKNMRQYGEEDIQREMALISQDVYLFHRTIRENLTLGEDFSEDAIQRAVEASALTEVIERKPLGLEAMVGEEGSQLSGGEKQRVAIARALLHNRSILLVDEGTSALDRENANKIEEALLRQKGITLLLISHHLTEERKKEFDGVYGLKSSSQ
ncbi:MAG: ABC transporter ATP-binding protein [Tissierellia bacterium]|nr:ABC transporter ATP-binding protein [Tissierellia bacterium]